MASISYFYVCLAALFTSLIMIPPVSKMAVKIGGMDSRDVRKVHQHEVPRLAGVAIFCAFTLAFFIFVPWRAESLGFAVGAVIIFLTGIIDDLTTLSPRHKFAGEGIAALAAVLLGGARLESVGNLFGFGEIDLGFLAIPFSVLAVVGVINAINLLDGLDGLAGGATAIASVAFGILAFKSNNSWLLAMAAALLGALIGFLKYNTYPARVFMGDSGSLFLGYCMGVFSISLINGSAGKFSEMTPLIILAVPVLDTLFVMFNRLRNGRRIFSPDRTHIHHRLLNMGVEHKSAVVIVYCLCYFASVLALLTRKLPDYALASTLLLAAPTLYLVVRYLVRRLARRGLGRERILPTLGEAQARACRRAVYLSRHLRSTIKYLAMFALLLSAICTSQHGFPGASVAAVFLALSLTLVLITGDYANRFLLFILYFVGGFLVFGMDNQGRHEELFGVPMVHLSHGIFILLALCEGVEVVLRRKKGMLVNSALEYLILLMAISIPILPMKMLAQYHLLAVGGKSIILFIAYKMVLTRRARASRMLVVVTQLALLACVVKMALLCMLVLVGYGIKAGILDTHDLWRTEILNVGPVRLLRLLALQWQRRFMGRARIMNLSRVRWWFQLQHGEFDRHPESLPSGSSAPAGPMWQKRYPVHYRSSR